MIPLKDENPTSRRPIATLVILAACIGIYFLWQPTPFSETTDDVVFAIDHAAIPCEVVHDRPLTLAELRATYEVGRDDACGIAPDDSPPGVPDKSIWLSVVVSMFLHGSILHLAGNVLFLWIFGNNIEDRLGTVRYVLFYLVGGVAATAAHVLLDVDSTIAMVGASGAIAAVMGAYLVWFPRAPILSLIIIFPVWIQARFWLAFWFVLQFFTAPDAGVAWVAHVGGFVFGVVMGLLVRLTDRGRDVLWARAHRADDPWGRRGS